MYVVVTDLIKKLSGQQLNMIRLDRRAKQNAGRKKGGVRGVASQMQRKQDMYKMR